MLAIDPITPSIGAEISGLDFSRPIPVSVYDEVYRALLQHLVIFVRGTNISLEHLEAVHDLGDFRNSFATAKEGRPGSERLNEGVSRFGHNVRPLIAEHPVTGRKFLNFNEAFVTHIVGKTTNESNSLKTYLADHMNRPEDQIRWRWSRGDLAMWDNRVTMHYALADYLPHYRCMNRITVVRDRRASNFSL